MKYPRNRKNGDSPVDLYSDYAFVASHDVTYRCNCRQTDFGLSHHRAERDVVRASGRCNFSELCKLEICIGVQRRVQFAAPVTSCFGTNRSELRVTKWPWIKVTLTPLMSAFDGHRHARRGKKWFWFFESANQPAEASASVDQALRYLPKAVVILDRKRKLVIDCLNPD